MFPYFSFFLADQLQALGYPIPGLDDELRPGHRRYNFAWYRVADAPTLKRMCVDSNGEQHDFSVPPPLIRKELIAEMRTEAEALLPPQFLDRGVPIGERKKSPAGKAARAALIASRFGDRAFDQVRRRYPRAKVADDDINDAFAALWTAERIVSGSAGVIPEIPTFDPMGLRMAIWY